MPHESFELLKQRIHTHCMKTDTEHKEEVNPDSPAVPAPSRDPCCVSVG